MPACPLCGALVPTPRGISPDMTVSQHIGKNHFNSINFYHLFNNCQMSNTVLLCIPTDQFCRSDKTKIFTNKCSFRGCKKKELIPVQCGQCKLNFCLRHRHTTDHECNPKAARSNLLAYVSNQTHITKSSLLTILFLIRQIGMLPQTVGRIVNQQIICNPYKVEWLKMKLWPRWSIVFDKFWNVSKISFLYSLLQALARSIQELDESHDRNRRNQQQTVPCGGDGGNNSSKDKCLLS